MIKFLLCCCRDAIIGINERLNESEILREGTNENREQSFKLLLELSQKVCNNGLNLKFVAYERSLRELNLFRFQQ